MTSQTNPRDIEIFQEHIMSWWKENCRDLPWRENPTPYEVMVSEIMLQQTQVSRVVPKFKEFMDAFPTVDALANAGTKHVLQVWSGLGYNRRALWLKEAATQIAEMEVFPNTVKELRELKGIGPYTSRSILIFAFNRDLAAVDTNIRRVLIASGFADENMSEKELQSVADKVLLVGRSRDWHNALMDYGSKVLTSSTTGITPTSTQSCFEGSSRQIRGAIIRTLTETDELDIQKLRFLLDCEIGETELSEIVNQLISEGLVKPVSDTKYRIVD